MGGPPQAVRSSAWMTPCGLLVRWCHAATRPFSSRAQLLEPLPRRASGDRGRPTVPPRLGVLVAPQQVLDLVGLEQAGQPEVVLLLRAAALRGHAELAAVEDDPVEVGLAGQRREAPALGPVLLGQRPARPRPAGCRPGRRRPCRPGRGARGRAPAPSRRRAAAGAARSGRTPTPSRRACGPGRTGRRPGRRTAGSRSRSRRPRPTAAARRRPPRPSGRPPSTGRRSRRSLDPLARARLVAQHERPAWCR